MNTYAGKHLIQIILKYMELLRMCVRYDMLNGFDDAREVIKNIALTDLTDLEDDED